MFPSHGLIPEVRKIAILRANGIGDLIFALPALEALRAAYPEAEIVLMAEAWHRDFLSGRPGPVDRVEVLPKIAGVILNADPPAGQSEIEQFLERMRAERFDLALQLHGGGRYSNAVVNRLGARVTAGFRTPDAEPLDRWLPYVVPHHEVLRFLEAGQLVGAAPVTLSPRLVVTDMDREESSAVVPDGDRPLIALNPGAGDPERRWPPEGFAAVGDALAAEGARVVVTGAGWDTPLARVIAERMAAPMVDTTGRLTLRGLAGLFSRCAVVVSNDSGPLHLAAAVGTATVGLYWGFNLVTAGPIAAARHRPVVAWRQHCPICHIDRSRFRCDHHPSFVADIEIEHVTEAARALLTAERAEPARPWVRVLDDVQ